MNGKIVAEQIDWGRPATIALRAPSRPGAAFLHAVLTESGLSGTDDGLHPVGYLQLGEDVRDVVGSWPLRSLSKGAGQSQRWQRPE